MSSHESSIPSESSSSGLPVSRVPPTRIEGDRAQAAQTALGVLNDLFQGKKEKYHADYAAIIAFLVDLPAFRGEFNAVSKEVEKKVRAKQEKGEPNKLTTAFYELFQEYGADFPRVQNVVLVGSSFKVFGAIVSNGLHFKDATGPGHGEYTHMLQRLTIARASRTLKLQNAVVDLYKQSAGGAGVVSDRQLIGENGSKQTFAYWNVLVDYFPETESIRESAYENLYSSTFRSPGFLTRDLRSGGMLAESFIAGYINRRIEKRLPEEASKMTAELLRGYHVGRQSGKEGRLQNRDEGVNVILPETGTEQLRHLLANRKTNPVVFEKYKKP